VTTQAGPTEDLRRRLKGLWHPHALTEGEKARVITTVTSIVGHTPPDASGWNMFPDQVDPSQRSLYATTLALLALLHTHRANLPWEGSTARRDTLLESTAKWLIERYDEQSSPPGWHGIFLEEDSNRVYDGLTLQIYDELLWAEAEAGVKLPVTVLKRIPDHLIDCNNRSFDFPITSGTIVAEFTDHQGLKTMGEEPVQYLWHPWAIDCAFRWLDRSARHGAPAEQRTRVRRALGHLVVDLGEDSVRQANLDSYTFRSAEMLYGLSAIAPP
jgi:hypothetical protein